MRSFVIEQLRAPGGGATGAAALLWPMTGCDSPRRVSKSRRVECTVPLPANVAVHRSRQHQRISVSFSSPGPYTSIIYADLPNLQIACAARIPESWCKPGPFPPCAAFPCANPAGSWADVSGNGCLSLDWSFQRKGDRPAPSRWPRISNPQPPETRHTLGCNTAAGP